MLAFPLAEAESLLRDKVSTAQSSLVVCTEDLEFLREQITTMEVNIARTHNHNVQLKRMQTQK